MNPTETQQWMPAAKYITETFEVHSAEPTRLRRISAEELASVLAAHAPQAQQWIPCSERLPENTNPVEILIEDDSVAIYNWPTVGYHNDGWWTGYPGRYVNCEAENWRVTYWRPLPTLPTPLGPRCTPNCRDGVHGYGCPYDGEPITAPPLAAPPVQASAQPEPVLCARCNGPMPPPRFPATKKCGVLALLRRGSDDLFVDSLGYYRYAAGVLVRHKSESVDVVERRTPQDRMCADVLGGGVQDLEDAMSERKVSRAREARMRTPKTRTLWGVYNWGNPVEIFSFRRDAYKYVREESRHYQLGSWRKMYEIHKVRTDSRRPSTCGGSPCDKVRSAHSISTDPVNLLLALGRILA